MFTRISRIVNNAKWIPAYIPKFSGISPAQDRIEGAVLFDGRLRQDLIGWVAGLSRSRISYGGFFSFKVGQKFKYCQELRGDLGELYWQIKSYSPSKNQHIFSINQGCSEGRLTPIQTEPSHANVIRKSNSGSLGRGVSRYLSKDKPGLFVPWPH